MLFRSTTTFNKNDFFNYIDILKRCRKRVENEGSNGLEKFYNQYLNYQYLILLGYSYPFILENKNNLLLLKEFSYLLNSPASKQMKIISLLAKYVGLKTATRILYLKIKSKGIQVNVT